MDPRFVAGKFQRGLLEALFCASASGILRAQAILVASAVVCDDRPLHIDVAASLPDRFRSWQFWQLGAFVASAELKRRVAALRDTATHVAAASDATRVHDRR